MLLQAENQTAEYPRHETIVSLFEAQAEKMPDMSDSFRSSSDVICPKSSLK
jgi:non-ribosomal peptide synthetase component F